MWIIRCHFVTDDDVDESTARGVRTGVYIHRASQSQLPTESRYAVLCLAARSHDVPLIVHHLVRAVTLASRYLIQAHGE